MNCGPDAPSRLENLPTNLTRTLDGPTGSVSQDFPRGRIEPHPIPLFPDVDPLMEHQVSEFGLYVVEFLSFEEKSGSLYATGLSDELADDESGPIPVRPQASRTAYLSAGAHGHSRADKKDLEDTGR
jgi:hypothetical protein